MANPFTPEQISQILEEFFKVVGTRQYIGARYVPIFGRKGEESIEWDNSAPYEPLTIVLYQGNSYTSRQYVPVGVEITNQEFWAITGNYNAQVELYRQEVRNLLPYDETPTEDSTKAVTSDGIKKAIDAAVSVETTRAKEAEQANATAIDAEKTRAEGAEQANATAIANETANREAADTAINQAMNKLQYNVNAQSDKLIATTQQVNTNKADIEKLYGKLENVIILPNTATFDEIQSAINDNPGKPIIANNLTYANTLVIPYNTQFYCNSITYTGTEYGINLQSCTNSNIHIGTYTANDGGMFTITGFTNGANITVDEANCKLQCIYFNATSATTICWMQYVNFYGSNWKSTTTDCVFVYIDSSIGKDTAWFNSNTFNNICFNTTKTNHSYGINFINRPDITDVENAIYGIDNITLNQVYFEKCFYGIHMVSVSGLRGYALRFEETINRWFFITVLSTDIIVDCITFINTNLLVEMNLTGPADPVIKIYGSVYTKDQSIMKESPNYAGVEVKRNFIVPIYNIHKVNSNNINDWTANNDFSGYLYNQFINGTYTLNLNSAYNYYGISDIYILTTSNDPVNITVKRNGAELNNKITSAGHYKFADSGNIFKVG